MDKQKADKAAWSHYWQRHPDVIIAECSRPDDVIAFTAGAEWGEAQVVQRLHNALKGLGLEKHSIALNVLRIAQVKLPEPGMQPAGKRGSEMS